MRSACTSTSASRSRRGVCNREMNSKRDAPLSSSQGPAPQGRHYTSQLQRRLGEDTASTTRKVTGSRTSPSAIPLIRAAPSAQVQHAGGFWSAGGRGGEGGAKEGGGGGRWEREWARRWRRSENMRWRRGEFGARVGAAAREGHSGGALALTEESHSSTTTPHAAGGWAATLRRVGVMQKRSPRGAGPAWASPHACHTVTAAGRAATSALARGLLVPAALAGWLADWAGGATAAEVPLARSGLHEAWVLQRHRGQGTTTRREAA